MPLQGIHVQRSLGAGRVGQESCQTGFKDQSEIEDPVVHALTEDGEGSGFADDEVGPLHDDDGDEEGRVAGVLQILARFVRPLLQVRILHIVDALRIPRLPQTQKPVRQKPVLSHDDKVSQKSGRCLNDSDLAVRC